MNAQQIIREAANYGYRLDTNDVQRDDDGAWRINGTHHILWFGARADELLGGTW
ncbi:MAG: hypothetical protein WBA05_17980 [Gordonia sp. (in: high G+C Gram-positive bacteria)]|uniref:hypothetical protein n=1 Tax=Gordonia sp. (in: high G+C Gram-positive bacteria) TaxID=84139 RepID=UPI003C70DCF6